MSINSTVNENDISSHSGDMRNDCCGLGFFHRNRSHNQLSLLAISIALLSTAPAFAQDANQDCKVEPNDCITVADQRAGPDIVVAARVPQYASQIGQSVTVITRDEIEQRQTVAVSDLLATTPGITVSRNGGLGTVTAVRIRGAEGEQTLTLIDGVRVNDPSSPGGAFDFGSLLAGSIDRIEILRGPNSVPWGSQAIGGVVNIVTARPTEGLQGRGSMEYGSFDSVFANAGISGGRGPVTASLTGGYARTDGISIAANGTEPDGYRRYAATGQVGIAFTDEIGVDLRGYYAHSRTDLDGFASTPPYGLIDDPEYSTSQEIYGYAGVHANLLDGRFRNRAAFTIADINRDNFDPRVGSDAIFFGRGRSERYEYQGDFQASRQLRLVAGVERENSNFRTDTDSHASHITSYYGQAIVTPIDILTVTGGVRRDENADFDGHTSYSVNAALALPEGTIFRGSYADGFKAPTLYQRFASFYGTIDLKPEVSRNYDFGVEQRLLSGAATIGVTYFHRDTKNQIDFDSVTFTYSNIVRTRAKGVEVELSLRPTDALTLTGNVSYIDSENRSPGLNFGKDLARRPKETANMSVDYRLPFGLSVGGTVSIVGDSFDDAGNTTRLDGYVLTGLRAEMPIGDRFSVYGRIENLFDEKYQTVANYGTPGRAAYGGIRVKLD